MSKGSKDSLVRELYEEASNIAIIDIHTHLRPGSPGAKNLYDILSYHFVTGDMECAGMPEGEWESSKMSAKETIKETSPDVRRRQ